MKAFVPNEYPTLGVEEEFHLIDPAMGELTPRVDDVMAALDEETRGRVCHELFLSVMESNSPVARTADELVEHVIAGRCRLADACERVGVRLVAAGTHPFSDWRKQTFVDSDHYRWVRDQHGIIARRMMGFGLHVHVGLAGPDEALYVMSEMRRWAYPLAALAANSPFLSGQDSQLASVRTHLFNAMPRTLLPPRFADFGELEDYYEKLLAAGDITRPGDLWWSLRPQPPLGTLEVRTMDLPTDVYRIGAFSAVFQAAAATYQDRYRAAAPPGELRPEYLSQNRWRAMRDGLDARIIEPETGEIVPMRAQLERLFDFAAPKAEALGGARYLELARTIIRTGNEAEGQRRLCRHLGGDLRALELELARRTVTFASPF